MRSVVWGLCGLLLAWLAGLMAIQAAETRTTGRPNVVFLFSDDQRFDTIRALGNRYIQTPNLDRLVRNGFAFTNAFCMGSMVGAVCVPSRAMVMTGRTLFRALASPTNNVIPAALPMWPEVMQKAGYTTIGIGKWHNDRASYARAFNRGGPIFFGGMTDQFKVPVHDFDPAGRYDQSAQHSNDVFSSELFANAAIKFLRERREKPFFLYVAFTAPHDPRTPPKEFAELYDPAQMPLPRNFLPEHPFDNGQLKGRDEELLPWPRTPDAVRQEIAAYYGMITHLDIQIGRILKALEETGQMENTLIVFAGDHGLAIGSHGLLGKQNLYEHSMRPPLILSGPGIPKGKTSAALCFLFDLYPTICEFAGIAVPRTVEGKSLVPVITGRTGKVRDSIFGAYRDVQRSVRNERWKLIHYPKLNRHQLFDLANDPDELNDLSADPRYAARLAEMRAGLAVWQKEVGDPLAKSL